MHVKYVGFLGGGGIGVGKEHLHEICINTPFITLDTFCSTT